MFQYLVEQTDHGAPLPKNGNAETTSVQLRCRGDAEDSVERYARCHHVLIFGTWRMHLKGPEQLGLERLESVFGRLGSTLEPCLVPEVHPSILSNQPRRSN